MKQTRLKRGAPLNAFSKKRLERLAQQGVKYPTSTFAPKAIQQAGNRQARRAKDTGPKKTNRQLVHERSGGWCEWPGCPERATDVQHRLGRKAGGRYGEMSERINGPAWLLHCCRFHHERVTSAYGAVLADAKRRGWVLTERQNAVRVPVLTRHDEEPVWLLNDGSYLLFEEACA